MKTIEPQKTLHAIIPSDELNSLKSELSEIKTILSKKNVEIFKSTWIEGKEVPTLLGISSKTWQNWRDRRIISFSQFGAKIYVKMDDINQMLESHRVESFKSR